MLRPLLADAGASIPYSSQATNSVDLVRDGYIVGIDFVVNLVYSTASAVTYNPDPLFKAITAITVKGASARYIDVGDPVLLHALNRADYGDGLKAPNPLGTSQSDTKLIYPLVFHFGDNVLDPFDPLSSPTKPWVVIPAKDESELIASITWGAASDIGSGVTVNTSQTHAKVAVSRVQGTLPPGVKLYRPAISSTREVLNTTWSNFAKRYDIPTGGFVRRIVIGAYSGSPLARSNSMISRVGLILPKDADSRRLDLTWDEAQMFTLKSYIGAFGSEYDSSGNNTVGASNGLDGIIIIDLRKFTGSALGLNLVGVERGDVQLAIDTTATGEVHILWDKVEAM